MPKTFVFALLLLALACQAPAPETPASPQTGRWRFVLQLRSDAQLPFIVQHDRSEAGGPTWTLHNARERIAMEAVSQRGDSLFLRLPIFDSEFRAQVLGPDRLSGQWHDYSRGPTYAIPFTATRTDAPRFAPANDQPPAPLAPRYAVSFSPGTGDAYPAVGVFARAESQLSGTFLTETGDYRYLDGRLNGNRLQLSAFDGSHAFLFVAEGQNDSLKGTFYSGSHWEEPWVAVADPDAQLRDPSELTYLKPGYESLDVEFPNQAGELISLDDPRYQGKVVIVQLLGSWCPNCMDETRLFAEWHRRYQDDGLEVIGLAFERAKESETAWRNLGRLREALGVEYELLLAATRPDKAAAEAALPALNHVMSFPTSIFIDRQGRIRHIHTGFYGPGTGAPYLRFVEQYEALLEELLGEP
jgi:peroxiredoxin